MPLQILGINHTTAPVDVRERVVIPDARLAEALSSLKNHNGIQAGIIVSTCNRTELYCETEFAQPEPLTQWLAEFNQLQENDISPYIYHHLQEAAIKHVLRVASGLDSMILGEPQVLGQLKNAYQTAAKAETLGVHLDRLFQHTFSVAKLIRSETSIGSSPVSVAYAAVTLAKQIFSDLSQQSALLIGAGETIELVARHLNNQNIQRMIIANRNFERAHHLAKQFDGYAIGLDEISSHLAEADIVISSTASEEPIVSYQQAKEAVKLRRHQPIFMVDIAVPRDIESKVAELEDIYLYTVDDLQDIIQENLKSREAAAVEAEEIVNEHVSQFMDWVRSRDAVPTIQGVRQWADDIKEDAVEKAQRQLQQGKPADEVLALLAHSITNKLIHNPTARIREAGLQQDQEVIEAARRLFGLDEQKHDKDESNDQ